MGGTYRCGVWTGPEHERFIQAMGLYPRGPWKLIADHVATRSIKQVQTHAQKYQQKLLRQQRGLRKVKSHVKRPEHRVDATTKELFTHKCIVRYAQRLQKEQDEAEAEAGQTVESSRSSAVVAFASVSTDSDFRTLGDWFEMPQDPTTDSKLLDLLPEIEVSDEVEAMLKHEQLQNAVRGEPATPSPPRFVLCEDNATITTRACAA